MCVTGNCWNAAPWSAFVAFHRLPVDAYPQPTPVKFAYQLLHGCVLRLGKLTVSSDHSFRSSKSPGLEWASLPMPVAFWSHMFCSPFQSRACALASEGSHKHDLPGPWEPLKPLGSSQLLLCSTPTVMGSGQPLPPVVLGAGRGPRTAFPYSPPHHPVCLRCPCAAISILLSLLEGVGFEPGHP